MSLRSMTGFGRGSALKDGVRAEVEVGSVNRRQLDIQHNLSRALQVLEPRVQEQIGKTLSRGRISLRVHLRAARAAAPRVEINEPLARALVGALRKTARALDLPDGLDSSLLLAVPDLLVCGSAEDEPDRVWPALTEALARALRALDRMRGREGRALERDLAARFDDLAARARRLRTLAPDSARRYRDQLHRRLQDAGLGHPEHADRIAREVAIFADRCDFTEELTRLESHCAQGRVLLRARDPSGRALDFLAQELQREINTVGSKAADAAVAAEVVAFKAELERIREQVQNVE